MLLYKAEIKVNPMGSQESGEDSLVQEVGLRARETKQEF